MTCRSWTALFLTLSLLNLYHTLEMLRYSLGVDYGTSGLRICLIDAELRGTTLYERSMKWKIGGPDPISWISSLRELVRTIPMDLRKEIGAICVSGTSSTALIYDKEANAVWDSPRLYDYNIFDDPFRNSNAYTHKEIISKFSPENNPVQASTSTLMKLLTWHSEYPTGLKANRHRLLHQADFISNYLQNYLNSSYFCTDWHNALKLGYDIEDLCYPNWLVDLLRSVDLSCDILPKVVEPGTSIGSISSRVAADWQLPRECEIVAGTTDSIAAFLAAGTEEIGDTVTSLGSTLTVKVLSKDRIEDASLGVYSHRLGNDWLVGGASNVGCHIFRVEQFSDEELNYLSKEMCLDDHPFAEYYPLTHPGERFPINDAKKLPILDPKPSHRKDYLFALFHAIARIERESYDQLERLGAFQIKRVFTAGGGSQNPFWTALRAKILQRPVEKAMQTEASYGAAILGSKVIAKVK